MNHLPAKATDITPYVLLPGDPERVDIIGNYLDTFKILGQKREYRIGKGMYHNIPITVVSGGIGCPSTAIAIEELIEAGAKYVIRVGTCGGAWRSDIKCGSLIIPTACIRDEGTTREYIPLGFPAVADIDIVNALTISAQKLEQKFFTGINRTHDAFYGTQESILKWGKYLDNNALKNNEMPILSSEMESAALFIIASLRNIKAGAVLAVNSEPESLKERISGNHIVTQVESNAKKSRSIIHNAIKTALEAIEIIAQKTYL